MQFRFSVGKLFLGDGGCGGYGDDDGGGGVTCHFPSVPPYQLESQALCDQ